MRNKRMRGLLCGLTAAAVLLMGGTNVAFASEIPPLFPTQQTVATDSIEGWPKAEALNSDTACVMDVDSGAILYNKNMDQRMYPASTTKIMTALVALENASLNETVTATETGASECTWDSSNLGIMPGEQFTVKDCLYAVLMKSANDFASQIAEHVGGTVENFVNMMNARAAQIGCMDTHFSNAHGMPAADHYTTAHDLVLIMREAMKNESFCKITGAQSYTIPATSRSEARYISSHNALIMQTEYYYDGCQGGKTGFTDESMCTFVSFAQKNGRTLITAAMHADTQQNVFEDTIKLLDYGFDQFQNISMDEGHDVYSGGMVTIPVTASAADVVMTEGETVETDFGRMVCESYTYHDYPVGNAEITETLFKEKTATPPPTPTPSPEPTETEPEDNRITRDDIKNIDPKLSPLNLDELITVPHIVMGVLILLIFIGLILIVAAVVKKSLDKKRKKKRIKPQKEFDIKEPDSKKSIEKTDNKKKKKRN